MQTCMAIIDNDPLLHQRDIAQSVKASPGGNNNRTFLTSYSISYNSVTCQTKEHTLELRDMCAMRY